MVVSAGARLVQTCESMCEELRRSVGSTLFRIELTRRPTPLVITLRSSDPLASDPRHEWMRCATRARIERPLVLRGRHVGRIRIDDERRSEYPADAVVRAETVITRYTPELAELLDQGQL